MIVVSSQDSDVLCGLFWHRLSTCSGQMLTVWCLKVLNLSAHSSGLCGCSVLVQYSCDSHLLILFGLLLRSIALHAGVCMTGMMSDGYMVRSPYTVLLLCTQSFVMYKQSQTRHPLYPSVSISIGRIFR